MTAAKRELVEQCRAAGIHPRNLPQAVERIMAGDGVRATARAVGISKNTATKIFAVIKSNAPPCACGRPTTHSGWCSHRLAVAGLPSRHVTAGRHHAMKRFQKRSAIIGAVNARVPRWRNQELRGEVTQEIFLAILEGAMTLDDIPARLPALIRDAMRIVGEHRHQLSLDASENDARPLIETLVADPARLWEDTDEFDFDTHCFGCGERGEIRRVHGHWQCQACGCVIETCCDW